MAWHSARTSAASGSSLTPEASGPTSNRCTSSGRSIEVVGDAGEHARHVLQPVPAADLQHDSRGLRQRTTREGEVRMRADGTARAVPADEVQAPAAVREGHDPGLLAVPPERRNADSGRFLVLNGSREGGITQSRSWSTQAGAYLRRLKIVASTCST